LAQVIKYKALALSIFLAVSFGLSAYSDVDILTTPHPDMQITEPSQKVFSLKDALDRIEYVSPQLGANKKRVDQFIIQSKLSPNEIATPLNWNITFFEVPGYMILEEFRKITFGRYEGLVMKTEGEAKARLETDNYNISCLETKNDLKKLYVSSVINDTYVKVLTDNSIFFASAYKDAVALESKRIILPSDLLRIQNYYSEIRAESESRQLKAQIYKENLAQIVDENKVILSPSGAVKTDLYAFDLSKINTLMRAHPEIQKNMDLFAVLRSARVYKKLQEKQGIEQYFSITLRRVIFEGPFVMIKSPSIATFTSLFKDKNKPIKAQMFQNEIDTAGFELKASLLQFTINTKTHYYQVQDAFKGFKEAENDLIYKRRVFFEQQQLYKSNLAKLVDLADYKASLYKAELNYLDKLEAYNLSVSDLEYYVGQYND
jgi:hypothetical protein